MKKNKIIEYWYDNGNKLFSIHFFRKHWKLIGTTNNGYRKGIDSCNDRSFRILGLTFTHTIFNCKKIK